MQICMCFNDAVLRQLCHFRYNGTEFSSLQCGIRCHSELIVHHSIYDSYVTIGFSLVTRPNGNLLVILKVVYNWFSNLGPHDNAPSPELFFFSCVDTLITATLIMIACLY